MNQFAVFVRKEWWHILRDKRTLVILFGLPVILILIFGFALSNEVKNSKIAIQDLSNDHYTQQLIQRIEASEYFQIVEFIPPGGQVEDVFKKGDIRAVVIFPPSFESQLSAFNEASIQLISDASDPNIGTTMFGYISSILNQFQNEILSHHSLPYSIEVEVRMLYNPQLVSTYSFVPGVMAMVLLLICSLMTSVAIVREKELGTLEVLLVSPVKPIWLILSKTVPYLLISFLSICTILVLSFTVLHVPLKGNLVLLLLESLLFIITSLALGMLVSSIAETQTNAMFGTLVALFLPTLMFSGFMFPIDNMPLILQFISNFIPSKWFFYIVKSIMIKGLGFTAVWKETMILFGMTVFLLWISIKKFKLRLNI